MTYRMGIPRRPVPKPMEKTEAKSVEHVPAMTTAASGAPDLEATENDDQYDEDGRLLIAEPLAPLPRQAPSIFYPIPVPRRERPGMSPRPPSLFKPRAPQPDSAPAQNDGPRPPRPLSLSKPGFPARLRESAPAETMTRPSLPTRPPPRPNPATPAAASDAKSPAPKAPAHRKKPLNYSVDDIPF